MSTSSFVGQLAHSSSSMSSYLWILDSTASHYMSPDSSCFSSMSHSSSVPVMTIYGTPMPLEGVDYVVPPNLSLSL